MNRYVLAGLAYLALAALALGQSSPGLITGQVPTAGQWNSYFAAKQDVLPFTPVLATTSDYWSNNPGRLLTTDQLWGAGALVTLTDAATVTPNLTTGLNFTWTLGAVGRTLANPSAGIIVGKVITVFLVQDSGGSRTITTWGSFYKFSGGTKPTLSVGANAVDRMQCQVQAATVLICTFQANFS